MRRVVGEAEEEAFAGRRAVAEIRRKNRRRRRSRDFYSDKWKG
jgi:hypothetical protein